MAAADMKKILEEISKEHLVQILPSTLNEPQDLEKIAKSISENTNITEFIFNGQGNQGNITPAGITALSNVLANKKALELVQIINIDITNIAMEFLALLEALKTNQKLTTLILNINAHVFNNIHGSILQAVFSNPWLRTLTLKSSENFIGNSLALLKNNRTLTALTIILEQSGNNNNNNPVTNGLATALSANTALTTVRFSGNVCSDLAAAIKTNATLITFIHMGGKISEKTGIVLGDALAANRTLRNLKLNLCGGGLDPGIVAVAKALVTNNTLEKVELVLQTCLLSGAAAISTVLESSRALFSLSIEMGNINNFSWGNMGDRVIAALAPGLRKNNSLFELNLDCKSWHAESLLSALELHPTLKRLTGVIDKDSTGMTALIRNNKCLEELSIKLHYDNQNDKNLSEALSINQSLKILSLTVASDVGPSGSAISSAVAAGLRDNQTLESISITSRSCAAQNNNSLVKEFSDTLKSNMRIIELRLQNLELSPIEDSSIASYIARNKSLMHAKDVTESLHNVKSPDRDVPDQKQPAVAFGAAAAAPAVNHSNRAGQPAAAAGAGAGAKAAAASALTFNGAIRSASAGAAAAAPSAKRNLDAPPGGPKPNFL